MSHHMGSRGRFVDARPNVRRALIAIAPWQVANAVLSAREIQRSPRRSLIRGSYLIVYLLAASAAWIVQPILLVPIALAAAAATAIQISYVRASYGTLRGLPPGGLPLIAVAPVVDHDFYAGEASRLGPVFKTISPVLAAPTVCVVGLPLAQTVLREQEASLCPIGVSFDALIPRKLLRSMSADDHPAYRRLFQRAFRDDVVDACLPDVETVVGSGLSSLADVSLRASPRGLAPRSHLESVVLTAFLRLFFGLNPDSVAATAARAQLVQIGQDVNNRPRSRRFREVAKAADGLASMVREQGALICRGLDSGVQPLPSFLEALLRERRDALDDPTITLNLVFLTRTAATDVTGLLHWILKLLGDNPEWIGALRASPDADDLSHRVVMETLRLEQSELLFRTVREEITIGDYVVPAGWHLRICVHESHRDPTIFDQPERFDPDRFKTRYNRQQYSPLGALGHTCLGARTTYALAGAFVQQVAAGYDLVVTSDSSLEFSQHWRPGRRHRIVLRRRNSSDSGHSVVTP